MLRRQRPRLTPEQVLESRPVRNPELKTEPIEGGGVRVFLKARAVWWARLLAVVLPIPRERLVELDAVGAEVLDLCDGEHRLLDMINLFQQHHKLTRAEAEWSLRTYLRDLGRRRIVGFAVEELKRNDGQQPHRTRV